MGILIDSCAGVLDASVFLKLSGGVAGAFDELLAEVFVTKADALSHGLWLEPDGIGWAG